MPNWRVGDPVLLYGADDWGDDEPGTPSPREEKIRGLSPREGNIMEFKDLHNNTILLIGFACGYLIRSFLN
mgnify:CR=1 FL=1|tara:strand:- start:103 stop:315 length:213 start_codon:yes stop_codon:yes gene_type:complete